MINVRVILIENVDPVGIVEFPITADCTFRVFVTDDVLRIADFKLIKDDWSWLSIRTN